MKKYKHIAFGNGHITWTGKDEPTKEQLQAFEKMRELALLLHDVSNNEERVAVCECTLDHKTVIFLLFITVL
jgi:hypothetical protein